MSTVPVNRLGLVVGGRKAGLYVRVEPTEGGFSIIFSDYSDMIGGEHGGDDWVAAADLDGYFEDLHVDWTIPETDYAPQV